MFDDIDDNTEYTMYLTIGNDLPYYPIMVYTDSNIRQLNFTTP